MPEIEVRHPVSLSAMTPESIGSGVAAFFTTIGVLAVLYLGLLGFLYRLADRPLEYLVGLAMIVASLPLVAILSFRFVTPILAEFI